MGWWWPGHEDFGKWVVFFWERGGCGEDGSTTTCWREKAFNVIVMVELT